ncbi:MAG TPA: ATP-binding protein, partial [Novosphingobium sp.]|nr:ATP-binding protein [Novosphingobium sp.]
AASAAMAGLAAWHWRRGRAVARAIEAMRADRHQLDRARIAAETASYAKSRYLATVSHEIRSPLNAIYGYAQLVERDNGAGAPEAASVIRRCAEHITSLVEALLDMAQVENGVFRVKTEAVRLDGFLEQILRMVKPAAASKGLAFVYAPQGRLPEMVRVDQGRLRQVLLNLLFNAIKYTDHGEVTFSVKHAGQIATFEVRDTGHGIPLEDQETIFQPYERGGHEAVHAKPGAGLGLSISRAVVDILGGQLELVSSDEAGTCFRVTLMLGEVAAPVSLPRQKRVTGYIGPRRRVLVVDDDAEQRRVLCKLLRSLDFRVDEAGDGETAVALCGAASYDLAILDISLPGMSGWEVAAHVRQIMGEAVRITMLSANAPEFHRPELGPGLTDPAHDHFLVKPVAFTAVIETIGGLLDLAWVEAADPAPVPAEPAAATPADGEQTELDAESKAHITRIRELLRIGHVRGIEAEIRLLAEHAPGAKALTDQLFSCLDRFDLPGMARILEHL